MRKFLVELRYFIITSLFRDLLPHDKSSEQAFYELFLLCHDEWQAAIYNLANERVFYEYSVHNYAIQVSLCVVYQIGRVLRQQSQESYHDLKSGRRASQYLTETRQTEADLLESGSYVGSIFRTCKMTWMELDWPGLI